MTLPGNQQLIAKLDNMIHDCLKDYISNDEPLAILDFPDIRNSGDSAFWLGEKAYLNRRYGKRPADIALPHHQPLIGRVRMVEQRADGAGAVLPQPH